MRILSSITSVSTRTQERGTCDHLNQPFEVRRRIQVARRRVSGGHVHGHELRGAYDVNVVARGLRTPERCQYGTNARSIPFCARSRPEELFRMSPECRRDAESWTPFISASAGRVRRAARRPDQPRQPLRSLRQVSCPEKVSGKRLAMRCSPCPARRRHSQPRSS